VVVDEDLTVRLKSLLRHAARSGSRFVPLGHGRFLALTDAFLTRLRDLAALCPEDHAGPALPSLAAPLAGELPEDFGSFERPDRWDEVLERARAAELAAPRVPADFSGTLRQYQEEGFAWLSKLAARGAGACLADDMGLGKTIQVLALLLDRATQGPGLVVAPTSLCINWIQEASRFTPALRFVPLAGAEDRAALIRTLGPGQVLVCTYGLLQNEQERLSAVDWGTAVLDEAQAIKNPRTKRARAAFRISARFRIAATGTPIENHLSELWSLFRYLNPLLLGTFERFSRVYARPIEQDRNVRVRERLRRVIQPFVLRRTKAEVLQELPERTEIVRRLEALPRERAFYEVLRREALERLAQVTPNARERNVQILAEMTRLRLACCNPGLITPEARVPSCKEEAFRELVLELLDNGHKALVFSQFVRHLTILRQVLDELGVHYQYLDGQTPAALRDQRVRAFQGGEGDLFLISLKAGGTGLNLTAADYVIHMDPWWNPAAEDQASDRAHRIGQERPVTIYRLVVRDTIEDRIVALHHDKRELAENLLAGTDVPRNVSPDEMIRLLGGAADDALASPDTES
jgi:SNF2 family DNA or RNA helicase